MVVRKVVALIVVSKFNFSALFYELTNIMCITYLLGSIFFTFFINVCLSVREKIGNSQGIVGEKSGNFDSQIRYELYTRSILEDNLRLLFA